MNKPSIIMFNEKDRPRIEPPSTPPTIDELWRWMSDVPDPEIPVISVVDLGIVRDIQWRDDTLVVAVTPTYSGCPATSAINQDIESMLNGHGLHKVIIEQRLSPAWTTDWITAAAREKLREYGIAPPDKTGTLKPGATRVVPCPQCESNNTERVSQFGSTPCKASYRCLSCLEPFDYFKCL